VQKAANQGGVFSREQAPRRVLATQGFQGAVVELQIQTPHCISVTLRASRVDPAAKERAVRFEYFMN
jgi:hypothetical protein